jgi:hypothetical protein
MSKVTYLDHLLDQITSDSELVSEEQHEISPSRLEHFLSRLENSSSKILANSSLVSSNASVQLPPPASVAKSVQEKNLEAKGQTTRLDEFLAKLDQAPESSHTHENAMQPLEEELVNSSILQVSSIADDMELSPNSTLGAVELMSKKSSMYEQSRGDKFDLDFIPMHRRNSLSRLPNNVSQRPTQSTSGVPSSVTSTNRDASRDSHVGLDRIKKLEVELQNLKQEKSKWEHEREVLMRQKHSADIAIKKAENLRKELEAERKAFLEFTETEKKNIEAAKADMNAKIERERRVAVRQARSEVAASIASKEKNDILELESLKKETTRLKLELSTADVRYRDAVSHQRAEKQELLEKISSLESQLAALQSTLQARPENVEDSTLKRLAPQQPKIPSRKMRPIHHLNEATASPESIEKVVTFGSNTTVTFDGKERFKETLDVSKSKFISEYLGLSPYLRLHLMVCPRPDQLRAGVQFEIASLGSTVRLVSESVDNKKKRIEKVYSDGTKIFFFQDGTEIEFRKNDEKITRFFNGDIKKIVKLDSLLKQTDASKKLDTEFVKKINLNSIFVEIYYFAESSILQAIYKDESLLYQVFEYSTGQLELHWLTNQGAKESQDIMKKEVLYPDGTLKACDMEHNLQRCIFTDKTIQDSIITA